MDVFFQDEGHRADLFRERGNGLEVGCLRHEGRFDLGLSGFGPLDAPVSGGAVKARAGEMTVMGAGSDAAFVKAVGEKTAPVIEAWVKAAEAKGLKEPRKLLNEYRAEIKKLQQ